MRFSIKKSRSTDKMIIVINGRIKVGEVKDKLIFAESFYWKRKMQDSNIEKKTGLTIF